MVSGAELIRQDLYRRLTTPRGSLEDVLNPKEAANYGLDLASLLNHGQTPLQISAAESSIAGECEKSVRVLRAIVKLTKVDERTWNVDITAIARDESVPITLALNVNDVTVTLLEAPQ
jgi:phage baseplate assembly protein W